MKRILLFALFIRFTPPLKLNCLVFDIPTLFLKPGIFAVLFCLITSFDVQGQKIWTGSGANANWNTAANWGPIAGAPTAAQSVTIPDNPTGANKNPVVNVAAVCSSLTMVTGASTRTLTINTGSSLTIGGAVLLEAGTGGADKTIAVGGGALTCASITMNATGADAQVSSLTISTGTVTVSGDVTLNDADVDRNIVTITSTGTLNVAGTNGVTGGNLVTATGSTVNYNGTAQTVRAINYGGNLTLSTSGIKSLTGLTSIGGTLTMSGTASATAAAALTIGGGVTLGNGTTFVAGSFTHSVAGNWANNGATFTNTGSTINLNGAAQTISGSSATTFNNLTISGSGVKTMTTVPTVNGTLSIESAATISAPITYGGSATLQYNVAAPRNTGVEWPATFNATGGVFVTNVGTITMATSAKVLGTNSPLEIDAGAALSTANLNLTFGGNFVNDGTFNAGASAFTITGTATQSIDGFSTTADVLMSKTNGVATLTGDVDAANLTINGAGGTLHLGAGLTHTFTGTWTRTTGTLDGGSSTLQIGGNVTNTGGTFVAGTGTVEFNGTAAPQVTAAVGYYNLILSGTGAKTLQAGTTTIGGAFTMSGTASTTAVTGLTIGGSVVLGSGTSFTAGAFTHNVGGDWANNGTTFTNTGSTINFNGAAQNIGGSTVTTFNNLTLSGSGVKGLQSGAATIAGNFAMAGSASTTAVNALTIGGSVTLGGTSSFTGGGFTHNVAGNWTNNGGTYSGAGSTINLNGAAQAIGGTSSTTFNNLTTAGTGNKSFNIATFMSGTLTIASAATAVNLGTSTAHTANALVFAGAGQVAGVWGHTTSGAPNTNATFFGAATGTITVAVKGATTYYSRTNGTWGNSGAWSTVTYGNATNNGTFPVAGDIVNMGGGYTITVNAGAACASLNFLGNQNNTTTVSINTGVTLNVSGAIDIPSSGGGIFSGNSNTLAVNAGILNAGSLSFSAGGNTAHQLTISTGTATISGDVTQGGLIHGTITFTNNGLLRLGGDLPNYIALTPSTGTVQYEGTSAQNVSSITTLLGQSSYYNLTFSGAGVKTAGGDIDINSTFTLGSGTSFVAGSYSHTLAGNWVNNGTTFTNTGSTINLNGAGAQSIGGTTPTTFNDLTFSNSGTKTFGFATTIEGVLSVATGVVANLSTFTTHSARALSLGGSGQVSGSWGGSTSAATNINTTFFATAIGILNVTNRVYYNRQAGNWNNQNTWSTVTYGDVTNLGNFPVAGDIVNIGNADYTITVNITNAACAALNFQAATSFSPTVSVSAGNTLTVSGGITLPQANAFSGDQNTVAVAGTLNAGSITFNSVLFSDSPVLSIAATGAVNVSGDVTNTGSILSTAAVTFAGTGGVLRLGGAFLNSSNGTLTPAQGTVIYQGSTVAQDIGDFTYYNLTLNNTSGSIPQLTLLDNTTATNALTMTSGIVNLDGNTFTLGASGAASTLSRVASTSTNWMYGGSFTRFWPTGQTPSPTSGNLYGLFPIGHSLAGSYRPVAITGGSNITTTGSVSFQHVAAVGTTDLNPVYDDDPTAATVNIVRKHNSQFIGSTSGIAGGTNYTLTATMTDLSSGAASDVRMAVNGGGTTITNVGTHLANTGTAANPTVGRTGLSVANLTGDFRITTINSVVTPLPINLLFFRADVYGDAVTTTWATAQELNNAFFTVERATNIENFQPIGDNIDGAGTTKERHDYSLIDDSPIYGRSYYRLKQTDFDGQFTYSDVRVVDYDGPKFASLRAYPNPTNGAKLTVLVTGLKEQSSVPLHIYNVQGQLVYSGTFDVDTPGTFKKELEFGNPLRSGIYLIKAGQTLQLTQKVFVE